MGVVMGGVKISWDPQKGKWTIPKINLIKIN